MTQYSNSTQFAELVESHTHIYPKYGKSTTDPTYYEPAATRIANMRKASGVQLEGIYDFYQKDDVEKFNAQNFDKSIREVSVDPHFVKGLTREEVSQITSQLADKAQNIVDDKKAENKAAKQRINEAVTASKVVENTSTDDK